MSLRPTPKPPPPPQCAPGYDASFMAVSLVATIGMLVSTLVTISNPQLFRLTF
jgi:hypothetical protein